MSHPNKWSGLGCLAIMTALGCADETVNLGGGSVGQEIQRGVRCRESPIVDGSVRVTSQAEMEDLAGCEEIDGDLLVEVVRCAGGDGEIGDRDDGAVRQVVRGEGSGEGGAGGVLEVDGDPVVAEVGQVDRRPPGA